MATAQFAFLQISPPLCVAKRKEILGAFKVALKLPEDYLTVLLPQEGLIRRRPGYIPLNTTVISCPGKAAALHPS